MGLQERVISADHGGLAGGMRVLIVEDHALVAAVAADMIEDLGGVVAAVTGNVEDALVACTGGDLSLVLLDLDLDGRTSRPVAAALAAAGIPFIVTTGAGTVPAGFGHAAVLTKPYTFGDLRRALTVLAA